MIDNAAVQTEPEPPYVGRRTAQGGGLMVIARLLTRLVDLGTMLTLTRILVPADFGVVAIALTVVNITDAALDLPVNQALLRLPQVTRSHYDTAFTVSLLRGALVFLTFLLAAKPFAIVYGDARLTWLIIMLGLSPLFRSLPSPRLAEFQKKLSFWRDFAIEMFGKLSAFICCTSVALLTHSYWTLAVGTTVYPCAMTLYSYYLAPYRPRISLSEFRLFYGFFGWASAAQIVGAANWQFERLLLGKVEPMERLGLFTTSSDLSNIPFFALFGPMLRPLLAAFTHLSHDRQRLAASYKQASSAIMLLGLPLLVGEALVAEPLVLLVLGPRWSEAAHFVRWLSLSLTPALFTCPLVSLLMAFGEMRLFFFRNVVELSIKVPIAIIGVLTFGFTGVIFARFASEFVISIVCVLLVRRLLGLSIWQQFAVCWRAMIATTAMSLVVGLLLSGLPKATTLMDAMMILSVTVVAGGIVYGGVVAGVWMASGRPDGLERMAWNMCVSVLGRLRSSGSRPVEPRK